MGDSMKRPILDQSRHVLSSSGVHVNGLSLSILPDDRIAVDIYVRFIINAHDIGPAKRKKKRKAK